MALSELQLPMKANFYGRLQSAANKMNNIMRDWSELAEFIERVDTADLDAIGVPAGDVRTDLVEFRNVMQEVVAFFKGTSTIQTQIPETVVDKIRSM